MTKSQTDTLAQGTSLRDALINALDSPTISALSKIFSGRGIFFDKSYSEQVAEVLYPRLAAQPPAAPVETKEDWREDPSADERWNAGLDYGMVRFCACLGVDPKDVRWDAATEELDGDVCAVIGNILRAKFGENFDPDSVSPCSAESVGCGTPGCTDPNCDYGKGPLRCQSCGAVVVGEPQEAPNRENLRPFAEWANRNRSAVSHEAADELILLARKACDAYGPLSRPPQEARK